MTKLSLMAGAAVPAATPPHDTLLTTKEAAAYLRSSARALEMWRGTGAGPAWVRIGPRRVVYRMADLVRWVEGNTYASRAGEMRKGAA